MLEPTEKFLMFSYPGIVASVTSRYQGKQNIMSAGWHTLMGFNPGIYGISVRKETFSYGLMEKSRSFGINFLPSSRSSWIQASGTFTGYKTDKFRELGISYRDGLKMDLPILTEAYGAYECKILDIHSYGTHEFIVGEIVQGYRDNLLFQDEMLPDLSKLHIPLHPCSVKDSLMPFFSNL